MKLEITDERNGVATLRLSQVHPLGDYQFQLSAPHAKLLVAALKEDNRYKTKYVYKAACTPMDMDTLAEVGYRVIKAHYFSGKAVGPSAWYALMEKEIE